MEIKHCIMCDQLIEDEDYYYDRFYYDESFGTYWCMPCGNDETKRRIKDDSTIY